LSLVVVGTDTDVGKTVICALLIARYSCARRLAYWKPIATGAGEGPSDRERVARWIGDRAQVLPENYLFDPPVAPHLAARLAKRPIDPERILESLVLHAMTDLERHLVIEGVGGVLVPISESGYLLVDLIAELSLPCLVVARSRVGTINHTLLTLEALRTRRVDVAGVVMNGPENRENRRAIEKFGAVPVIAEVPPIPRLGRAAIASAAAAFDRRGRLSRYFR
jgi:dethiobiotin synthetase